MVATDGGLMPTSQNGQPMASRQRRALRVPRRLLASSRPGTRIELQNLSNTNNRDFDNTNKIMAFDVVDDPFTKATRPRWSSRPRSIPENEVMTVVETKKMKIRNIRVQRDDATSEWKLNGETWHDVVDSGFQAVLADPALGDTEVWDDREQVRRLVPPGPHPPDRLQDPDRNGKAPFA